MGVVDLAVVPTGHGSSPAEDSSTSPDVALAKRMLSKANGQALQKMLPIRPAWRGLNKMKNQASPRSAAPAGTATSGQYGEPDAPADAASTAQPG